MASGKTSWLKKALGMAPATLLACSMSAGHAMPLPDPLLDAPLAQSGAASPAPAANIVLAGGCFWGVQAVFQHTRGVKQAVSGYAGGTAQTANYHMVSTGTTGHAEAVKVTYDPSQITIGQIFKIFFSVAHDPTEIDRQGPDRGTEYRSAIFTSDARQQKIAAAYIAQLDQAGIFGNSIATKIEPLTGFYPAENYHQDFARLNPDNAYIVVNDAPKVVALEKLFPQFYVK